MRTKYNNQKIEILGKKFDSKKEAERYLFLKDLENNGKIQNLECQVKFDIIPNQYNAEGKLVEKKVTYIADFVYLKDGNVVVEDVKGYRSSKSQAYSKYVLKRKLMRYFLGVTITEV